MTSVLNNYVDAVMNRNSVLSEALVGLARKSAQGVTGLYQAAQRVRQRRARTSGLQALNDHQLRDIGLTRYEISGYVQYHSGDHTVSPWRLSPVRRLGDFVRAAWRWHQARRTARVTERQLRSLDRRQLADIGLQPGDIDWLVRDLAKRSRARPTAANDNRNRDAA